MTTYLFGLPITGWWPEIYLATTNAETSFQPSVPAIAVMPVATVVVGTGLTATAAQYAALMPTPAIAVTSAPTITIG